MSTAVTCSSFVPVFGGEYCKNENYVGRDVDGDIGHTSITVRHVWHHSTVWRGWHAMIHAAIMSFVLYFPLELPVAQNVDKCGNDGRSNSYIGHIAARPGLQVHIHVVQRHEINSLPPGRPLEELFEWMKQTTVETSIFVRYGGKTTQLPQKGVSSDIAIFARTDRFVVITRDRSAVSVYDVKEQKTVWSRSFQVPLFAVKCGNNDSVIVVESLNGRLLLLDAETGADVSQIDCGLKLGGWALHPRRLRILIPQKDGYERCDWSKDGWIRNRVVLRKKGGDGERLERIRYSGDGTSIIGIADESGLWIINDETESARNVVSSPDVVDAAISPDGGTVALQRTFSIERGPYSAIVELIDLKTHQRSLLLPVTLSADMAFSGNGVLLIGTTEIVRIEIAGQYSGRTRGLPSIKILER